MVSDDSESWVSRRAAHWARWPATSAHDHLCPVSPQAGLEPGHEAPRRAGDGQSDGEDDAEVARRETLVDQAGVRVQDPVREEGRKEVETAPDGEDEITLRRDGIRAAPAVAPQRAESQWMRRGEGVHRRLEDGDRNP